MRIISRKPLEEFGASHSDAKPHLEAWYNEVKAAAWKTPHELKIQFPKASILKAGRVVFNICHNTYRLVVGINYKAGLVYIRFLGTHPEYDKIDAETI